jgi:hypothetical protein
MGASTAAPIAAEPGSAVVTLYNGITLASAVPVRLAMIRPDGTRTEAMTSTGAYVGYPTAQFSGLDQPGTYRFGLADQPTSQPQWTSVLVTAGTAPLMVPLQVGGASLTMVDQTPGQPSDYRFAANTRTYNVTWTNPGALQQDLVLGIDPATLPAGWVSTFTPPVVSSGQSSTLTVYYPDGVTDTSESLTIRGLVGSSPVAQVSKTLNKNWSLGMDFSVTSFGSVGAAPTSSVNAWWTTTVGIQVRLYGSNMPTGALAMVDLPTTNVPSESSNGSDALRLAGTCGWEDLCRQQSAGDVPMLIGGAGYTALNGPSRSWYNSGWSPHELLTCYASRSDLLETFIVSVKIGAVDMWLTSPKISWPNN